MRGPFNAMLRWWKESNGNGDGRGGAAARLLYGPRRRQSQTRRRSRLGWHSWTAKASLVHFDIRRRRWGESSITPPRFGDISALIFNNQRFNYNELLKRVNRMAGGLSRLGVRKGDRVVLALPNCPEYVVSFFAIQKALARCS